MVAAFVVSVVVWRMSMGSPLQCLVEVQSQSVYVLPLGEGDTLYFSPIRQSVGDSLVASLRFDYCADSASVHCKTKGLCTGSDGEVQTVLPVGNDTIAGDALRALIDSGWVRQQSVAAQLRRHVEELDYYARTHSAVDGGYNEVMLFGEQHRSRSQHADSTLVLLAKAARLLSRTDRDPLCALLRINYSVNGVSVRMDRQQGGLVRLLPWQPGDSIARQHPRLLRSVLYPWLEVRRLEFQDSIGNRFLLTERDSLMEGDTRGYTGECHGMDGSYYRGDFNLQFQREGTGFAVDGTMVKFGIWRAGKYQGEEMLYNAHRIYGIDISRYQHEIYTTTRVKTRKGYRKRTTMRRAPIHWDRLRITGLGPKAAKTVQGEINYPVSFVFIKCTQGTSIKSNYYAADLAAAKRHGIPAAPYHFFSHKSKGTAQARYFLKYARISQATMPPMLDVEPTPQQVKAMGGEQAMFREMLAWLQMVERESGRRPVLYVSQTFVVKYMSHAPAALLDYDVWIARYGEYRPYVKLLLWQLTPFGRVEGITGDVDINVFNGSRQDFERWVKS